MVDVHRGSGREVAAAIALMRQAMCTPPAAPSPPIFLTADAGRGCRDGACGWRSSIRRGRNSCAVRASAGWFRSGQRLGGRYQGAVYLAGETTSRRFSARRRHRNRVAAAIRRLRRQLIGGRRVSVSCAQRGELRAAISHLIRRAQSRPARWQIRGALARIRRRSRRSCPARRIPPRSAARRSSSTECPRPCGTPVRIRSTR